MRTFAVINQKGGVGKTTTVANLGAGIASRGRATCLIDLDPQGHLTLHLGIDPGKLAASVYDVMTAGAALSAATIPVGPNLWLVPSVIDLAAAETELVTVMGREQILRDRIAADPLPYEFVLIDCPPSLGLLTLNALAAADDMLIPVQPHFLALQGLGKLLQTANLVQQRINPRLRVAGVVLCIYEQNTRLAAEVLADLQSFFAAARSTRTPWSDTRIFQTAIRRNIKLAECPSHGQAIFDYEPSCRGARDYGTLAEEFLAWADGRSWQPEPDRAILATTRAAAPDADDEALAAAEDSPQTPHDAARADAETAEPTAAQPASAPAASQEAPSAAPPPCQPCAAGWQQPQDEPAPRTSNEEQPSAARPGQAEPASADGPFPAPVSPPQEAPTEESPRP